MATPLQLEFASGLHASRERVWAWMTSLYGIRAEMRPLLRMTAPPGVRSIADLPLQRGRVMFTSRLLLFGLLRIGRSQLTLVEFDGGNGLVEQSPMSHMRLWRHERRIQRHPTDPLAVVLVDRLTLEPRRAGSLVCWFVRRFFEHRHAVLRAHFGTA